ncbi:MAG: hypothetical protein HQK76_05155 [Desulfobacterales bacterium]|nr:hypothetical protein [Desulfobacterales bacterium]
MTNFKLKHKIRHLIKKIPMSEEFYNFFVSAIVPTYKEDGMRLHKNCSFTTDKDFLRGYSAALKQSPTSKNKNRWRVHVTQWAGQYAMNLDGDFVETGVDTASFSASIIEYTKFKEHLNKKFYLFDTFEGICDKLVLEGEDVAYKHQYKNTYELVSSAFKDFPNVIIVKGIVPYSLKTVNIEKIAYLSIDMNCAQPEKEALEFFWDKIVQGGIIILDDYCFYGRDIQKKYADDFANSVKHKILSLPTGQGLLIKSF